MLNVQVLLATVVAVGMWLLWREYGAELPVAIPPTGHALLGTWSSWYTHLFNNKEYYFAPITY